MKTKWLSSVIALALGLFATSSALGQSIVCIERVVGNTRTNWYMSNTNEGRMVIVDGQFRLAKDFRTLDGEPGDGSLPVAFYNVLAGGTATDDTYNGIAAIQFPPQDDGVTMIVAYPPYNGATWTQVKAVKTAGGQVCYCTNMTVPKGSMTSFVIRVLVEDWVLDGTPIDVEFLGISGLLGVTLGVNPEVQMVPSTGPWRMTWLKHPYVKRIDKAGGNLLLTVASPPNYWRADWALESSTNLMNWSRVASTLLPAVVPDAYPVIYPRQLQVPFNGAEPCRFFRTVLAP